MKQADSLLKLAQIGYSRSSALTSIQWTLVAPIFVMLVLVAMKAPFWVQVFFACVVGAVVLVILAAFIYFMRKNPDALRSENYALMKKAIEERIFGDNLTGAFIARLDVETGTQSIDAGPATNIERQNG
jgi:hypothetical protein